MTHEPDNNRYIGLSAQALYDLTQPGLRISPGQYGSWLKEKKFTTVIDDLAYSQFITVSANSQTSFWEPAPGLAEDFYISKDRKMSLMPADSGWHIRVVDRETELLTNVSETLSGTFKTDYAFTIAPSLTKTSIGKVGLVAAMVVDGAVAFNVALKDCEEWRANDPKLPTLQDALIWEKHLSMNMDYTWRRKAFNPCELLYFLPNI